MTAFEKVREIVTRNTLHKLIAVQIVWAIATILISHASLLGAIFDALMLYSFGRVILDRAGGKKLMEIFLAGVSVGAVITLLCVIFGSRWMIPGPSAGVAAVVVAVCAAYPNEQANLFGILPLKLKWMGLIYVFVSLINLTSPCGWVVALAQLGGAGAGFLVQKYRGMKPIIAPKKTVSKPKPILTVDTILDKISRRGVSSLTREEKDFLNRNSR